MWPLVAVFVALAVGLAVFETRAEAAPLAAPGALSDADAVASLFCENELSQNSTVVRAGRLVSGKSSLSMPAREWIQRTAADGLVVLAPPGPMSANTVLVGVRPADAPELVGSGYFREVKP